MHVAMLSEEVAGRIEVGGAIDGPMLGAMTQEDWRELGASLSPQQMRELVRSARGIEEDWRELVAVHADEEPVPAPKQHIRSVLADLNEELLRLPDPGERVSGCGVLLVVAVPDRRPLLCAGREVAGSYEGSFNIACGKVLLVFCFIMCSQVLSKARCWRAANRHADAGILRGDGLSHSDATD